MSTTVQHPSLDELRAEAIAAARKPRALGWYYGLIAVEGVARV